MARNITTFAPIGQFSTLTTPDQVFYFGANGGASVSAVNESLVILALWRERVLADGGEIPNYDELLASLLA